MALRKLLLRNKLDTKKKSLDGLREKDTEFEKREKELEDAINEMDENTSEEDRKAVEKEAEDFQKEKEDHESKKKELEEEIANIEEDLEKEEEKTPAAPEPEGEEKKKERGRKNDMAVRRKFFGMSNQERTAFFADEEVKAFLTEVRTCIKAKSRLKLTSGKNVESTLKDNSLIEMMDSLRTRMLRAIMKICTCRAVKILLR